MTKNRAFTMAEILLSLTIIGVVAAITLPGLTGNINERTWNTQRKALYARFSQAIALMPALNGYGTLTEGNSSTSTIDTAAETFITSGLSKVLKINNICDNEHLNDCGIPNKIVTMAADTITPFPSNMQDLNSLMTNVAADAQNPNAYEIMNINTAAFETANGESIATFYNPNCRSDLASSDWADLTQPKICANFIYDLNGSKGPNTVGKDIGFITVLYPTDSVVVSPMPHINTGKRGLSLVEAMEYCNTISEDGYRLPNKDEAAALFVNQKLIGNLPAAWLLTSSKGVTNGVTSNWLQSTYTGNRLLGNGNASSDKYTRCVKRN